MSATDLSAIPHDTDKQPSDALPGAGFSDWREQAEWWERNAVYWHSRACDVCAASPVPAVADDPGPCDLCGECGTISPTAWWQALDADPLDADGKGLRIVVAKGHEPSFWECPACRYLHRDDDADPGVWSGTREQMEAERASLVADGQEFVAGPGSRDTKEPGA